MPKAKRPVAKKKAAAKRPAARKSGSQKPKPTEAATVSGNYEKTAALSIPMVKFNAGDRYAFTIESVRMQFLPGGSAKTSAILLRAVNLDTGELGDFIAQTVLKSTLTRAYGELPDHDEKSKETKIFDSTPWDGKSVLVACSKREGKRYMDFDIHEIKPK